MPFPSVVGTDSGRDNASTHVIGLPPFVFGDLVVIYFSWYETDGLSSYPSGWTEISIDDTQQVGNHLVLARTIDGTEGYVGDGSDTVNIGGNVTQHSTYSSVSYRDAKKLSQQWPSGPTITGLDVSPSTQYKPGNLNAGETQEFLWVVWAAYFANEDVTLNFYIPDYPIGQKNQNNNDPTQRMGCVVQHKELEASSEDPANGGWSQAVSHTCLTMAIWPKELSAGGGFGSLGL